MTRRHSTYSQACVITAFTSASERCTSNHLKCFSCTQLTRSLLAWCAARQERDDERTARGKPKLVCSCCRTFRSSRVCKVGARDLKGARVRAPSRHGERMKGRRGVVLGGGKKMLHSQADPRIRGNPISFSTPLPTLCPFMYGSTMYVPYRLCTYTVSKLQYSRGARGDKSRPYSVWQIFNCIYEIL